MATVRELITKWGFQVNDSQLKTFEKNLKSVKTAVKAIGGITIAAAGSMFGMAQSTAKAGDEIAKTARIAGVGVEAFQELQFSADLAGVSSSGFATAMTLLTRNISEAAAGTGTAKDAFKQMGIQLKDTRTGEIRKTEDIFLDLAEGFKNTKSQADRVSFAMDILGRSGAKMSTLLAQGKDVIAAQREEMRRLGVITKEDARLAEDYIDAQTRLGATFSGIRNAIGAKLLPAFIKYTDRFRELILQNKEFIGQKIEKVITKIAVESKKLIPVVTSMWKTFMSLIKAVGGTESVIRLLIKALIAFIGLKIVLVIGGLIQGFFSLLTVIKSVGVAAALTNLKLIAIPLAIGVAFIAVGLIVQDFFALISGGKSVIAGVLNRFGFDVEKARDKVKSTIKTITTVSSDLFRAVKNDVSALFDILTSLFNAAKIGVGEIFDIIKPHIDTLIEDIKGISGVLSGAFNDAIPNVDKFFKSISDQIGMIIRDIKSLPLAITNSLKRAGEDIKKAFTFRSPFTSTPKQEKIPVGFGSSVSRGKQPQVTVRPQSIDLLNLSGVIQRPGITPPKVGNNVTQNININSPISVAVPANTEADKIAPIVKQSFKDALGEVLRETSRQVAPAHN